METHQQKSSEVIIPLLEHGQLHFGSGRVSELNIIITLHHRGWSYDVDSLSAPFS